MSLNLIYSMREGLLGLKRARLATAITITIISISLTLFGVFGVVTLNVQRIVERLKEQMVLEVFIVDGINNGQVAVLKSEIISVHEIEEVIYISKEEALKQFRDELNEDISELLGKNPLPASFEIKLKPSFRSSATADAVSKKITALDGVDEVVYRGHLFRLIDINSRRIIIVDGVLLVFVLCSTLLLIANTLRLTILSQEKNIQIMQLIGAKQGFIRRPYLIQGILQGISGGFIASAVVWIIVRGVSVWFPGLVNAPVFVLVLPLFLGFFLGLTGSLLGLHRFMNA